MRHLAKACSSLAFSGRAASRAKGPELKKLRAVVMTGNVQRHALLADTAKLELSYKDFCLVVYGFDNVSPIGGDNRAPSAQYPLVGMAHPVRVWLEFGWKCRGTHKPSRSKDVASSLEGIVAARYLVHLMHCRPYRNVNVFSGLV